MAHAPKLESVVLLDRRARYQPAQTETPDAPDWNTPRPKMEFYRDVFAFSRGGDLFVAHSYTKHKWDCSDVNFDELDAVKIDRDHVFPQFIPELYTLAPDPLPDDCYVKRQSLCSYDFEDPVFTRRLSYLVEREAKACEVLKESPHPNIAEYLGCVVEDGRIVGLCFKKYKETLQARAQRKQLPPNRDKLLQGIRDGVAHIHKQGYCHNDIHDRNIMMGEDDVPVIIDFDSCLPEGDVQAWKGGAPGWSITDIEDIRTSEKRCDEYSLGKMEEYLNDAYARQDDPEVQASDRSSDSETADDC